MGFTPRSEFVRVLSERGFIHQCTDLEQLDEAAAKGPVTAYVGYDLTAQSLHVGHLISIMMLRWLQRTGHRPIVLLGGGTTKIGDPTGKDSQRPLLSSEQIQANKAAIRRVFSQFIRLGDDDGALMVDNAEWLEAAGYIDFLRDYGPHFTIGRMLSFESVKLRLGREQPMSFLEFNYMLLQAADFHELYRRYGCTLQMGGSDQWGNIVNGVELIRRIEGAAAFGLTTPLLTTAAGHKMGKTMGGAVWLNADMLDPAEYHRFWLTTEDADVARFLKLFTDTPLQEIEQLELGHGGDVQAARRLLADRATDLLHGPAGAEGAG